MLEKLFLSIILGIGLIVLVSPVYASTVTVDIPAGTSVPGCEESNSCYAPADITINAGDTVEWVNVDTAAHTVTGGNPSDGSSGVFDSSLVMADAKYAFTFDDAGSYDYFCMVHPWMTGLIIVKESSVSAPSSISVKSDSTSYFKNDDIIISGKVTNPKSNIPVSLMVKAPNGNIVSINQILHFSDGTFSTSLQPNDSLWKDSGQYTFQVNYDSASATGTFSYSKYTFAEFTNKLNEEIKNTLNEEIEPEPESGPICGPGTVLVNGLCKVTSPTPSGNDTTDYTLYIIAGVGLVSAIGGVIAISKRKKQNSSSIKSTKPKITPSIEEQKGKKCNVCDTIIPEGQNVCPNCGDTYSI